MPNLVFKDKAVLSWVQKKVLVSNVFNFFALNELKFSQTRLFRFGKKGSLPSPGEAGQVSSWQECFCQSYKNWSESNGIVSGIYKAASSQKVLKHIAYSRLDSPVFSHILLIDILIKIYRIWELRPEGSMQEHTVLIPFHVSGGSNSMAVDWDLGFAGDSVYNECKCQPSKPSWRGMLSISKPALVQTWTVWFNSICSATGSWIPKTVFASSSIGSWCQLMPC